MTIQEALDQRIPRIRSPKWANPQAYLRLPLFKEGSGPWAELYDIPGQIACDLRIGSQRILMIPPPEDLDWEVFTGEPSEWEWHPNNFSGGYVDA